MTSKDNTPIVAVCAFCGRWRDSLGKWIDPPDFVHPLVELKIIDLSHTYCADCMEKESRNPDISERARLIWNQMATKERLRMMDNTLTEYPVDDIVHQIELGILPGKECLTLG